MAGERIGETVEGIGAALANHTDWFDSEKNDCKSWKSSYEKGFYNYAMDSNIRLFRLAEKRDARVGIQRQDINESIGMAVESNRIGGLQKLLINHAENPDIVIRTCSGSHYTILLIGHLHELADDKGHGLNPLDLLLGLKELSLEILLLILGVFFLDVDELELILEGFKVVIKIILVGEGRRRAEETLDVKSYEGERWWWLGRGFWFHNHGHLSVSLLSHWYYFTQ
ncbi:hypothetical protein AAG906_020468 [Vitis piasezkii]